MDNTVRRVLKQRVTFVLVTRVMTKTKSVTR